MDKIIALRDKRYTLLEAFEEYLFRLQVVEGAVSSLKAGQEPETMFWITQSIIQSACDAMVLHRAFVENWNPPLLH